MWQNVAFFMSGGVEYNEWRVGDGRRVLLDIGSGEWQVVSEEWRAG
jgi:hypothetical protein